MALLYDKFVCHRLQSPLTPVRYVKFSIRYLIDIDIFRYLLIDIDIFQNLLIDIDIFQNSPIDIDIFQNSLIIIDIDIFQNSLIDNDIDIFRMAYRYRYFPNLPIYRLSI